MQIAFIGLGEAAKAIISGWGNTLPGHIGAFDIKSQDPATSPEIAERARELGVTTHGSRDAALQNADIVFSTVTADQAVQAATECAAFLSAGALWCDLNSCAPASKQSAAALITAAGAQYLDVAVMAPVYPQQNLVPCLLSGPTAEAHAATLTALPMQVRVVGDSVGRASSIKMVRSILVKGLEALTAECVVAAVSAGVGEDVFPSLKTGHPKIDVPKRAAYNFERSLVHGVRRAAEMDEVVKMLDDLGLPNPMARGAAEWARRLGHADIRLPDGQDLPDHLWFARAILTELFPDEPGRAPNP